MLQSLFYLTIALHVSVITITHLQEHKTTVTTASRNRYTVIYRVKVFTVKEYLQIRLKLQLLLIMYILRKCNFNLICRYYLTVKFNSIYYSVTVTRCCSYSCFVPPKDG
jgi:hypothetical protein